jgi:hypothetical protein
VAVDGASHTIQVSSSSTISARPGPAARVALITCSEVPELEPDDQLFAAALRRRGRRAEPVVWDAPVDWSAYAVAVLRSPWDYAARRAEFVAWARTIPHLHNPAEIVEWNTDKRYLSGFDQTVPTRWLTASEPLGDGVVVIKPAVGAGAVDSGRYDLAHERDLADAHVARLTGAGRVVMVQPYLPAIDEAGETALMYFDGVFSHAIRKGALLTGPDQGVAGLYRPEKITPRIPSPDELARGDAVLKALPFPPPLYARVDLVPGPDGTPLLMEVELTEPSLFFAHAPGAADRLADALLARLEGVT